MKRYSILTVFLAVLVLPSLLFAANKLAVGDAVVAEGTVTVPLNVSNLDGLMAMDLPLKFSEGVTLKEVTFTDRVSYFDLKIADIDNENNTVAIGLITQIGPDRRPDLSSGTGAVANLVFEVNDPNVTEVTVEAVSMSKPDHDLVYIYEEYDGDQVIGQRVDELKMDQVVVALSETGNSLPTSFGLAQNYPNPFNPSTIIPFSLAKRSFYELRVFNVLGQMVTQISGEADAGEHEIVFDGADNASGVYFYKLTAGDFSETKKMMLLK
jgi:hypothetical protein